MEELKELADSAMATSLGDSIGKSIIEKLFETPFEDPEGGVGEGGPDKPDAPEVDEGP